MKIRYQVPEIRGDTEYDFELTEGYDLRDPGDLNAVVEFCAQNFHRCHDGWEVSGWPLVFVVKTPGDDAKFSVDLEAVPQFVARPL